MPCTFHEVLLVYMQDAYTEPEGQAQHSTGTVGGNQKRGSCRKSGPMVSTNARGGRRQQTHALYTALLKGFLDATAVGVSRGGATHRTIVQYLLLVFTIFEVLEGPMHGGNELETSNCNSRHNEPCKNMVQQRDICWCNN
jgi:hypothetical protein